jgi:hypothetical protein
LLNYRAGALSVLPRLTKLWQPTRKVVPRHIATDKAPPQNFAAIQGTCRPSWAQADAAKEIFLRNHAARKCIKLPYRQSKNVIDCVKTS